jgi:hypothetical protein
MGLLSPLSSEDLASSTLAARPAVSRCLRLVGRPRFRPRPRAPGRRPPSSRPLPRSTLSRRWLAGGASSVRSQVHPLPLAPCMGGHRRLVLPPPPDADGRLEQRLLNHLPRLHQFQAEHQGQARRHLDRQVTLAEHEAAHLRLVDAGSCCPHSTACQRKGMLFIVLPIKEMLYSADQLSPRPSARCGAEAALGTGSGWEREAVAGSRAADNRGPRRGKGRRRW